MTGRAGILAFLLASGAVQSLPALPGAFPLIMAFAAVAILSAGVFALRRHAWACRLRFLLVLLWGAALGLAYTLALAQLRLADSLDEGNQDKVSRVVLRVAGLARVNADSRVFEAEVVSSRPAGVPSRIQVSWNAAAYSGPYGESRATPAEFPELKMLAWNRDAMCPIPAEEAFALYERNWRFVDQQRLTARERQLIHGLAKQFGRGVLLTTT